MVKKLIVFISILFCLTMWFVVTANAEIVDLSIVNANDKRSIAVQEDPELCEYMYSRYSSYLELYDPLSDSIIYNDIYFSTKKTALCPNKISDRENVYISDFEFESYWVPRIVDNTEKNGWLASKNYQDFVEPHNLINKRLIEVLGPTTEVHYLLENEYDFQHQKEGKFVKYQIDIGKEVIVIYLDSTLSSEQANKLKVDNIMDTSMIYMMLALIIITVVGVFTFVILAKAKKMLYKHTTYY